jgi:REP element-mobilizing transposase RayT
MDKIYHHRRLMRLKSYDYSHPGAYFVTVCAHNREMLFGEITSGKIVLNEYGNIVVRCWREIAAHFPNTELDEFVVMPNHIHGIIWINNSVGANDYSPLQMPYKNIHGTSKTIGSIIRGFKIGVTKWLRQNTDHFSVWQRNYYEHIIRHDEELNRIRQYIIENPLKWDIDSENPDALSQGDFKWPRQIPF